jgi:serine/threonine protein kinase
LLGLRIDEFGVEEIIGRGFYGWTVKANDGYQSFVVKLIPDHRVRNRAPIFQEPRALAKCGPHPNIARFFKHGDTTLAIAEAHVATHFLVFDYIEDASPLRRFLAEVEHLDRSDLVGIISGICFGLARIHKNGLWHNDLHDDNILVRHLPADEAAQGQYLAVLIDFGSSEQFTQAQAEREGRSDYFYLSKHITALVGAFERGNRTSLVPADRTLAGKLRLLARQLADTNTTRRDLDPLSVSTQAKDALSQCATGQPRPTFEEMRTKQRVSLASPLANSNALNLEPEDVAALFTDPLGWLEHLHRNETTIVVGPRGCGKTMLLRHLSIATEARPRGDESREDVRERLGAGERIAFLVSCSELRTPFLRSAYKRLERTNKALAEDFCREYIGVHYAAEITRTIAWLSNERLLDVHPETGHAFYATVVSLVSDQEKARDITSDAAMEILDKRIVDLSSLGIPEDYAPSRLASDDVLIKLARALKTLPWTRDKELWFLIDDYSETLLTRFVQEAVNPILFRPTSELRIRVSSEGGGPTLMDHLGRRYQEGREVSKVNLGEVYFKAREDEGQGFIEAILNERCKETNVGSLKQLKALLGEHGEDGNFGRYIVSKQRPGDARFYGFGIICRLCSGDVSYIIELLRSIVGDTWHEKTQPVKPVDQDQIIKRFAQRQLADLLRTADMGPNLHSFATQVGALLRDYLVQSRDAGKLDERLRIEVEGSRPLNDHAARMHELLLRHSVLVDGGHGKSRTGAPTRRFFFRRLYAPCFPFSLARRGSIPLRVEEYEQWLTQPQEITGGTGQLRNAPQRDFWGS